MKSGSFDDEGIRRLQKERNRIDAEISRRTSRSKEARRKLEAKRNFIAGRVVLEHAAKDELFAQSLFDLLSEKLTGRDRQLFHLDGELRAAFDFAAADYTGLAPKGGK